MTGPRFLLALADGQQRERYFWIDNVGLNLHHATVISAKTSFFPFKQLSNIEATLSLHPYKENQANQGQGQRYRELPGSIPEFPNI